MTVDQALPTPAAPPGCAEERLERGELLVYPVCPFPLPAAADRQFLCTQRVAGRAHKNISYDPSTGQVHGFRYRGPEPSGRLRELLAGFSATACRWLEAALPAYRGAWRPDRASFRSEEEAIRRLRWNARNDLVHIDAFPTRPTHGDRILRLFVNLNPTDPRVWVTSELFARLLERYGTQVGLPTAPGFRLWSWRQELTAWLHPHRPRHSDYDLFMLRLHDVLKADDDFQERGLKRYWSFPPGSAWLLFSDGLSYADLRGQYALEHSFFVARGGLVRPDLAPATLLENACRARGGRAA
jgi:hypothetical protein